MINHTVIWQFPEMKVKWHESETENSHFFTGVESGKRVCVTVFFDAIKFPLSYHERRFLEIFDPRAPKILSLKQRFQKVPRFLWKKALPLAFSSDVNENTLFSCCRTRIFIRVPSGYLFTWRRRGLGKLLCHLFRRETELR